MSTTAPQPATTPIPVQLSEPEQDTDLILGTKGPMEQTIGVALLEPLAILHVRLAPGHLARVMGIDQLDIKPTLFEHCEQGHLVDPGRLQHDGLDLTRLQPYGQGIEISRKGPKAPHRLLIAILWNGAPVLGRPDINPGGIEIQLR